MATYATETIAETGTVATYRSAAGGGDKVTPAEGTKLHVKNGSGSSINVTLVTPGTEHGLAIADQVVAVPATSEKFIALDPIYRNPSDGLASITWSATTTVTFAVIR